MKYFRGNFYLVKELWTYENILTT